MDRNDIYMNSNMFGDSYVIRTPEDAVYSSIDGAYRVDLYIPPCGSDQINEVSDTTYYLGKHRLPYHYHDRGFETFIVEKGRVEVTLNAQKFILEEGDMINIEPWLPHGFVFIDEGCIWREMYTDMNMWSEYKDRELLSRSGMPLLQNEDFMSASEDGFDRKHHYFEMLEPVNCQWIDKHDVQEVTCKGEGKITFAYEGIKCLLKVGRWQMRGFKEVWEYQLNKGYQLQYSGYSENEGIYFVKSGRVMVKVDGQVLFASADDGDLIRIPAYTPYTLTAITDGCVLHDYNVAAHLFRLLEMVEAAGDAFPEKLEDPEYMGYLFTVNKVRDFTKLEKTQLIDDEYTNPIMK